MADAWEPEGEEGRDKLRKVRWLTIGWIPFVGTVLAFPLKWLVWALNYYTAFIESLPGAFASF